MAPAPTTGSICGSSSMMWIIMAFGTKKGNRVLQDGPLISRVPSTRARLQAPMDPTVSRVCLQGTTLSRKLNSPDGVKPFQIEMELEAGPTPSISQTARTGGISTSGTGCLTSGYPHIDQKWSIVERARRIGSDLSKYVFTKYNRQEENKNRGKTMGSGISK